jgi:hypothetical protein
MARPVRADRGRQPPAGMTRLAAPLPMRQRRGWHSSAGHPIGTAWRGASDDKCCEGANGRVEKGGS